MRKFLDKTTIMRRIKAKLAEMFTVDSVRTKLATAVGDFLVLLVGIMFGYLIKVYVVGF